MVLNEIIEQAAGRQSAEAEMEGLFQRHSSEFSIIRDKFFGLSSLFFLNADDDEDEPTFKERLIAWGLQFIEIFCVWDCCPQWLKLQKMICLLVFDPFVELFITLCIVVNTLFMALDHYDMDPTMERVLKSGNYVRSLNLPCKQISLTLIICYIILLS